MALCGGDHQWRPAKPVSLFQPRALLKQDLKCILESHSRMAALTCELWCEKFHCYGFLNPHDKYLSAIPVSAGDGRMHGSGIFEVWHTHLKMIGSNFITD